MVENMYDRLCAGESINVVNPDNFKMFTVEPAYSTKYMTTVALGYSIIVDGAVVPGHKGTLMDRKTITDWAMGLDEVFEVGVAEAEAWEEELNSDYFASRGV